MQTRVALLITDRDGCSPPLTGKAAWSQTLLKTKEVQPTTGITKGQRCHRHQNREMKRGPAERHYFKQDENPELIQGSKNSQVGPGSQTWYTSPWFCLESPQSSLSWGFYNFFIYVFILQCICSSCLMGTAGDFLSFTQFYLKVFFVCF